MGQPFKVQDEVGERVAIRLWELRNERADGRLQIRLVSDVRDPSERITHRVRHQRLLEWRQERLDHAGHHVDVDRRQLVGAHLALQQLLLQTFQQQKTIS